MLERDGIDVATVAVAYWCLRRPVKCLCFVRLSFHTTWSIPLLVLSNHESSCFLLYIMSGLVTGKCNCSSKHDISLPNRCPISHVCMCLCVLSLRCYVCLKSNPVFFSVGPVGRIWMEVGGDVMLDWGEEALHVHVGWKTDNGFWRSGWDGDSMCTISMGLVRGWDGGFEG